MSDGLEYDLTFIRANPIHTICPRCKAGEPIYAPSLTNVYCFWCSIGDSPVYGRRQEVLLHPADPVAYAHRLANLWRHVIPRQLGLSLTDSPAIV